MAADEVIVASAVVLPETLEDDRSPTLQSKRRQSNASLESVKRQKIANEEMAGTKVDDRAGITEDRQARRRASRDLDERKRGKRLFGALLGTLAQNSSSTAQRRRTDIEQKQREKLKIQAEVDEEKKKQLLDALTERRRLEQERYNEQTEHLRRSNALASAHFLQTLTEPKLFYKPWELRPEEETKIESQVRQAQNATNDLEQDLVRQEGGKAQVLDVDENTKSGVVIEEPKAEGKSINETQKDPAIQDSQTHNGDGSLLSKEKDLVQESSKDAMDEGGDDTVEGEEDAVIY